MPTSASSSRRPPTGAKDGSRLEQPQRAQREHATRPAHREAVADQHRQRPRLARDVVGVRGVQPEVAELHPDRGERVRHGEEAPALRPQQARDEHAVDEAQGDHEDLRRRRSRRPGARTTTARALPSGAGATRAAAPRSPCRPRGAALRRNGRGGGRRPPAAFHERLDDAARVVAPRVAGDGLARARRPRAGARAPARPAGARARPRARRVAGLHEHAVSSCAAPRRSGRGPTRRCPGPSPCTRTASSGSRRRACRPGCARGATRARRTQPGAPAPPSCGTRPVSTAKPAARAARGSRAPATSWPRRRPSAAARCPATPAPREQPRRTRRPAPPPRASARSVPMKPTTRRPWRPWRRRTVVPSTAGE